MDFLNMNLDVKNLKLTPELRMFILMHEYSHIHQIEKEVTNMQQRNAKNKKYFLNFPFDEKVVREFLSCKKEKGYFKLLDVTTIELSEMLKCPDYGGGFRIINVTIGKGIHNPILPFSKTTYNVNEDEVYITYNTQQMLSGGIYTTVMKKENGINRIIKEFIHSRS